MSVVIEHMQGPTAQERMVEIVERKGLGHPDTICDMLSERLSVALSRHYLQEFGAILHHNVDKALLVGGCSEPRFGGGRIVEPMRLFLSGRATHEVSGKKIPVAEIALETARAWFRDNMRTVDWHQGVRFDPLLRPGSGDLLDLFMRRRGHGTFLANDMSCGVGFAPSTSLERIVLAVEAALNAPATKAALPMVGEDIKVMGVRQGACVNLTVSCALVDQHLLGLEDYVDAKMKVRQLTLETAAPMAPGKVEIEANAADDPATGSLFLTVSGTSAEAGDDGETGRGNRVNGLITPCRPMTMEAMSGKNPVTHVGKLYNTAAMRIAERLVASIPGVREAECLLVSRIGAPVDQPQVTHVRVTGEFLTATARSAIEEIAAQEINGIPRLWRTFLGAP